jgi:hypothetical protein
MAVRQFLIPIAFSLVFWIPILALGGFSALVADRYSQESIGQGVSALVIVLYLSAAVVQLTDAFWILKGNERRRITDLWAKTDVLNECVPA